MTPQHPTHPSTHQPARRRTDAPPSRADRPSGFVAVNAPLAGPPDLTGPAAARRLARLTELGLIRIDAEWDAFARRLAQAARDLIGIDHDPIAMVNFLTDTRQFFAGMYAPPDVAPQAALAAGTGVAVESDLREMPLDHGGCPHVVADGKALVLDDVCAWRGFWGNPVVDQFGIRSYLGAPLRDRTGTILGTVCVIDREVRPWGRPGLHFIKARAADLIDAIHDREQKAPHHSDQHSNADIK